MSKDVLLIECERGNFHHINDTSESKEMSMQFCADMKDALIELSTLTAKVKRYEDAIKDMASLYEKEFYGCDEKEPILEIARAALNQGEEEYE